ncbi:MAG: PorT family protein [Cyclobacteriaceae bacterium]|nr:PorT family protein [Cyclobacteriaceae bacterium]
MTLSLNPVFFLLCLIAAGIQTAFCQEVHSLGIFSGFTTAYTWDEGILKDPRYREKYRIKFAPIGVHYGIDLEGYGFTLDPAVVQIGQYFNVINVAGGDVGERKIDLTYLQAPVGFKLHMIDLNFFKVSFVASASAAYLLKAKETITHSAATLKFPTAVIPNLPPDYTPTFPGSSEIICPAVNNLVMLDKKDFKPIQLFGAIGFRSDWDVQETLRISFDFRIQYGLLEPRTESYLERVRNNEAIYDRFGARRDLFAVLTVGISKTAEIEPREKQSRSKKRAESKPYRPSKYPWPGPRNKKPKS